MIVILLGFCAPSAIDISYSTHGKIALKASGTVYSLPGIRSVSMIVFGGSQEVPGHDFVGGHGYRMFDSRISLSVAGEIFLFWRRSWGKSAQRNPVKFKALWRSVLQRTASVLCLTHSPFLVQ